MLLILTTNFKSTIWVDPPPNLGFFKMDRQVSYDIFCTQQHTTATSSVHTAVLSVLDGREVGLVC